MEEQTVVSLALGSCSHWKTVFFSKTENRWTDRKWIRTEKQEQCASQSCKFPPHHPWIQKRGLIPTQITLGYFLENIMIMRFSFYYFNLISICKDMTPKVRFCPLTILNIFSINSWIQNCINSKRFSHLNWTMHQYCNHFHSNHP